MSCDHKDFKCYTTVNRLTEDEGGPVKGYNVDININCADCGTPFEFIGLKAGYSPTGPRVSFDGVELRAPIAPVAHRVH